MLAVIWIDWYAYHVARFRALAEHAAFRDNAVGLELVGGCGVHSSLRFRTTERGDLRISTLLPEADWGKTGQWHLARLTWAKLNRLRPTVLLIPGYYTLPAVAAAVWGRLHGKHTVLMTETTEEDYSRAPVKEAAKKLLLRLLFRSAVAGGEPHRRYLQKLGFTEPRIGRCYDVVDNRFYAIGTDELRANSTAAAHHLPEDYFLYVGRLAAEKNVEQLIRSFAGYRSRGGRWSLLLAGDGPLRGALQELASTCGVAEHVRFAGLKTSEEMLPYYAFAGALVLPSTREPWGLVVNEAMAAGLPVIVSSRCGCAEDLVQPNRNGWVFDAENGEQLAQILWSFAELGTDEREAMGRESRRIIVNYSPEKWAAEVARLAS